VQFYITPEVTKTAEIVAALGRLQAALKVMNVQVEFVNEAPRDGAAFIISSFSPADETTPYMNNFDITQEEGSEFINAPVFGEIGVYGNSILLLDTANNGNKLVLLANSAEDTVYILDTLSSGYLSGCLLQENMAVCSVGFGSSYSEDTSLEETPTSEEATPEPAATPQG